MRLPSRSLIEQTETTPYPWGDALSGLRSPPPENARQFDEEADQVVFRNRGAWWESHRQDDPPPFRSLDTYERAKRYTVGEDVYTWEGDWKEFWRQSGCPTLKSPDAAFLGFCKARYARRH